MATTKPEAFIHDPLEVKSLAIFCGLQLYLPMGLEHLIVEYNNLLAVQAIEEGFKTTIVTFYKRF